MTAYSQESALIHLKENWNDFSSSIGFLGYGKIHDYYNGVLSKNQIKKVLSSFESHSLMSETHQNKQQNVTIALHPRDSFQIDFFYINEISEDNDGVKYIFSAIDTFSKRVFCVPQIKCNAESSVQSLMIIFNSINIRPKFVPGPSSKIKDFEGI